MIFIGIIMALVGVFVYASGSARSNDVDAIMSDFFDSGVVDNGSDAMTLGMVLLVLGVIILIVGVVLNKNNPEQ